MDDAQDYMLFVATAGLSDAAIQSVLVPLISGAGAIIAKHMIKFIYKKYKESKEGTLK